MPTFGCFFIRYFCFCCGLQDQDACNKCAEKYQGCCTVECQTVFNLPVEEQTRLREGKQNGIMVFNKSKQRLRPKLNDNIPLINSPDFPA